MINRNTLYHISESGNLLFKWYFFLSCKNLYPRAIYSTSGGRGVSGFALDRINLFRKNINRNPSTDGHIYSPRNI